MTPFVQKLYFLSKVLGETVVNDNPTTRNVETAAVLHVLPTSTAIDLNKPLLLEITADTATYN